MPKVKMPDLTVSESKEIIKGRQWFLDIDDVHPSLNKWTRMHFHLRNSLKQEWELLTLSAAMKSRLPKIKQPVKIFLTYTHPQSNVDLDNYTPKFIIDGLKKFLVDDNIQHIKQLGWEFVKGKKHTRILIEVL